MASTTPSGRNESGLPRLLSVVSMGVVLLLLAPTPTPATPFDLSRVISTLADNVIDRLYNEGEMNLLGHYCTYKRQPYFHRWELFYRAQATCPGWSTSVGKSINHRNPNSAEREATRNLVQQIVAEGLVAKEEAKEWL
ncbi:anti-lipopolysaccharide factor-like [Homarus americanus]|uniref:Anti-lipopolysaccharide factor-like 6 n=1 Tax=Homarus americanus TaxID=6706 RepID=A0A8J5MU15_HOMAM|nr:anti-lipopolysaccharide factor-like [Homarus americanus]XP_042230799.1 anti-lipopolysaccharide factor-like [Homarus americanus]KAG7164048.1 anti-lipopolysaccharide factor-like 6 [Homarus americanus]